MAQMEGKPAIINLPVEDVWKFMTDFSNMSKVTGEEVQLTSEGPFGLGSTFRVKAKILGRQVVSNGRVAEWEPNKKITVEWMNANVTGSKDTFLMEPIEGAKTRLVQVNVSRVHGFLRIMAPFLTRRFRQMINENAVRIKRLAEGP